MLAGTSAILIAALVLVATALLALGRRVVRRAPERRSIAERASLPPTGASSDAAPAVPVPEP